MKDFTEAQKKDLEYFKENLPIFSKDNLLKYKHVIISNQKIQNSFDKVEDAIDYAINTFKDGNFIIQQIVDENEVVNYLRSAVG